MILIRRDLGGLPGIEVQQGQGWRTMGEGAEERCKVVFLREQALLQSYFSSQVMADQSVAMSVARLVWRD